MRHILRKFKIITLCLSNFFLITYSYADNHNIYEILDQLQKDIKTLEKAVYSGSIELNSDSSVNLNSNLDNNSEDVLTRHLLKLSEIENQFQELTNKFEEINFKLDKLSNRMSKVQADNQIRFQDLENVVSSDVTTNKLTKKTNNEQIEVLPGSSQPQDLGSISYKDTATNETSQKTNSVDSTALVVTETFQAEEKILPNESPETHLEEFSLQLEKFQLLLKLLSLQNLFFVMFHWSLYLYMISIPNLEVENFQVKLLFAHYLFFLLIYL